MYQTYRPLLFSIAYRILGTVMDAEDMVQETFITVAAMPKESVSNIKAYLCKSVTNRCIDFLRSAKKRRETYVGSWLPEPLIASAEQSDPLEFALHRDSLSLAYLLMMEKLSAVERAIFVLREALGFDYEEIARITERSDANCRKIFSRGKKKLSGELAEVRTADGVDQQLISQFLESVEKGKVDEILHLLAEDVTLFSDGGGQVRAALNPIFTRKRVAHFLIGVRSKRQEQYTYRLGWVNGTLGLLTFKEERLYSVTSWHVVNGQIKNIFLILNPKKLHLNA